MLKQITVMIDGKPSGVRLETYSCGTNGWCSSPKAKLAFEHRRDRALAQTLTERELRWIDQLNREPENQVDMFGVKTAIRLQA
jgi:hypothetical protein